MNFATDRAVSSTVISIFVVIVFVDQKSYIIECNYFYWGILLFLFTKLTILKSTLSSYICLSNITSNFYPD